MRIDQRGFSLPCTSRLTRYARKSRYEGSTCRASSFMSSRCSRMFLSFSRLRPCSRASRSSGGMARITPHTPRKSSNPSVRHQHTGCWCILRVHSSALFVANHAICTQFAQDRYPAEAKHCPCLVSKLLLKHHSNRVVNN